MKTTHTTTIEMAPEEIREAIIVMLRPKYPNKKISIHFIVTGENAPNDWRAELPLDYDLRGARVIIEE